MLAARSVLFRPGPPDHASAQNPARGARAHAGRFDLIYLVWSGPDEGPGIWWPGQGSFYEPSNAYGGVSINRFITTSTCWKHVFTPDVAIHETGHMMGLQDLYDYQPRVGPKGGIGSMDM